MDISVVIPLLNEEESLPHLIEWIHKVMRENSFSYEIILIDDGSKDNSWQVISDHSKADERVKAIRFQRNYGKSAALHVGFDAAQGEVVITMDADLQDSPDEIPELRRMIVEDGFDLVSGWKKKRHDPISKTIPTKLYNATTRLMSGIKLNDMNCGLKAYRKDVIKSIEVFGEMHRYIPVIAKAAGFSKIGEKVVQHRKREFGNTKFGLNRFINGPLDLLTITFMTRYMKRPMHFFGYWGIGFAGIGGGVLAYLAILKILGMTGVIDPVAISYRIPALFFGAVFFLLGVLFISTGLLAEFIGRHSADRNDYRIKEKTGLD
ncbi:MAG: glycosyltransferase family 2 protein [Bacteroidia bacterium]|nr:glycosyltransferase family 2 protein [Bacteroidia bacterium]